MPQNNQTRLYSEEQYKTFCKLIEKRRTTKGWWSKGIAETQLSAFKNQFSEKALKRIEERMEREGEGYYKI